MMNVMELNVQDLTILHKLEELAFEATRIHRDLKNSSLISNNTFSFCDNKGHYHKIEWTPDNIYKILRACHFIYLKNDIGITSYASCLSDEEVIFAEVAPYLREVIRNKNK